MSYYRFKDGYAKETTFGTSAIADAAATTYLWGAVSQESVHPSPQTTVQYAPTGVNAKEASAGNLWKGYFELSGMYGLRMQNGILCWAAMGKSTTTGADPYVHTITPTTDGSLLPSFTIQHERTGTGTDWTTQFTGVKIVGLRLFHNMMRAPFLMGRVEWMGKKAEKKAFTLTNDPALPATANTSAYTQLTRTFGGVAIDGLVGLEINIMNGLQSLYSHSYDTGDYVGMWLQEFLESTRKEYSVRIQMHPNTIETGIWDELVASSNAKDAVFTWTRSANDYIKVTCSDCQVTQHTLNTPIVGDLLLDEIVFEPRAVSIEVKDSIVGARYGE